MEPMKIYTRCSFKQEKKAVNVVILSGFTLHCAYLTSYWLQN